MYFSIVNFSWEGDARDTLTGIGFIHECSNEGHIYTTRCELRQGSTICPYGRSVASGVHFRVPRKTVLERRPHFAK